ncbi:MAG: hypothetical protein ACI9MR_001829 [Myxococcota bacterium]|jgi:hypothetical protein
MNGGQASCPTCNKVVDVPAGAEPLFSVLIVAGVLTVVATTIVAITTGGWGIGLGVFAAGAAIFAVMFYSA